MINRVDTARMALSSIQGRDRRTMRGFPHTPSCRGALDGSGERNPARGSRRTVHRMGTPPRPRSGCSGRCSSPAPRSGGASPWATTVDVSARSSEREIPIRPVMPNSVQFAVSNIAVTDAMKREPQTARIARAATEARIRLVVLQGHARLLARHWLPDRTQAENSDKGWVTGSAYLMAHDRFRHPCSSSRRLR